MQLVVVVFRCDTPHICMQGCRVVGMCEDVGELGFRRDPEYRRRRHLLVRSLHPDVGGDAEEFRRALAALDAEFLALWSRSCEATEVVRADPLVPASPLDSTASLGTAATPAAAVPVGPPEPVDVAVPVDPPVPVAALGEFRRHPVARVAAFAGRAVGRLLYRPDMKNSP